jgi:hypothetical protein
MQSVIYRGKYYDGVQIEQCHHQENNDVDESPEQ